MPRGVPRLTEMHRRRGGWSVPQPTTYRGYRWKIRVVDGQGRPWKATRSARALPGSRRKGAA